MRVLRLSRGISAELQQGAINIAFDCAKDLSVYSIVDNDPFEVLAQAEVCARLRSDFYLIENPMSANGVMSRGEAIFVLDDSYSPALVVGFSTYKPRFPDFSTASVCYIAVAESHRGQGVMRLIMDELLEHHPVVALDCPIELAELYKKFGFYVSGSQGGHLVMATGPITGNMFSMTTDDLMAQPPARAAIQKISKALGKESKEGFRSFNLRNELATARATEFAASIKHR